MDQVEKTINYETFKILEGNRKIDRYHLKKLMISIQKNNRLNLHPIIINKDCEVIDGQHRLEAAKQLNLEIFYIKSDTINDEHLIECNANQKSWEVQNFIEYFCVKKCLPAYIELNLLLKSTGLKPKALMTIILGNVTNEILDFLKTGKFIFPKNSNHKQLLDSYLNFISYVKDKRIKPFSMFSNHYFSRAFRWLIKAEGFDYSLFLKKLDLRWFDLKPQRSSEDWYKLLVSIYNFKNHSKIEEIYAS